MRAKRRDIGVQIVFLLRELVARLDRDRDGRARPSGLRARTLNDDAAKALGSRETAVFDALTAVEALSHFIARTFEQRNARTETIGAIVS